MEMEEVKTTRISEIVDGSALFKSTGVSRLKVTRNGEVEMLEIPIQSTGVSEILEEWSSGGPKPPIIHKVVRPDDEAFKELGLSRKQHVKTFDLTDPDYIKQTEEHQRKAGTKVLLKGLAVVFKDKEGKIIEDEDEQMKVMENMGLTGPHFTKLLGDIRSLTEWQEAREDDFLP
jgi:hypothetical protein